MAKSQRVLAAAALLAGLLVISREMRIAAIQDPRYHRHLIFGRGDSVRAKALGRELLAHERQAYLPEPQHAILQRIERAIADRNGDKIVVLMARQTGKNETEAFVEDRVLAIWRAIPGSVYVRTAPTHKPQLINSKLRLEKHIQRDPLLRGRWLKREGFIYESGGAQVQFLSGGTTANVVGGTANIALSVDEAHKMDGGKFEEDLAPFVASTNAPTILWGVAADELDLLHEYREKAVGTDRLFVYPASVWCEISAAYANHYHSRVAELGATHPVVLTQYDLVAVKALGSYLNDAQRGALFSGDHPRLLGPRPGFVYAIVVDLGGEAEEDLDDEEQRASDPGRDSTFAHVLEWDPSEQPGSDAKVNVRVVQSHWWTGRPHIACIDDLIGACRLWNVIGGVIDARGVGEAVAMAVHKEIPSIEPYKATGPEVSEDCFSLLAWLNCGRLKVWRGDPAEDETLREIQAQARHTRYQIFGHQLMRLVKPTGTHGTSKHIDGIKALTYLHRAIQLGPGIGTATDEQKTYRGQRNPFGDRKPMLRLNHEDDDDAA